MNDALTARQTQILKAIIDEYISTAIPVGSEALEKKYNLGVSPATIRNEMSALTKLGYLRQPHTSAGRTPSPKAMKFYVNQLMDEKQMSLTQEVKAKEEVWYKRGNLYDLMDEATHVLAHQTKSLAVSTLDEGRVWHSGYAYVFSYPEFTDAQLTANLFSLIEEAGRLQELFFRRMNGLAPIEVIFGEELGWSELGPIGIVGTRFHAQDHECALAVVGATRQSYSTIVPVLRYFRTLLQELG